MIKGRETDDEELGSPKFRIPGGGLEFDIKTPKSSAVGNSPRRSPRLASRETPLLSPNYGTSTIEFTPSSFLATPTGKTKKFDLFLEESKGQSSCSFQLPPTSEKAMDIYTRMHYFQGNDENPYITFENEKELTEMSV
jgi:hypothetical protein